MRRTFSILLAILLIAIVIAGVWGLVAFVGLQVSIVWTALLGGVAWSIRSSIEQRRAYQRLLADKKREQYFEFLDFLNHFVEGSKEGASGDASTAGSEVPHAKPISIAEFRKWSLRLTLIGSDDVVKTWNAARLGRVEQADSDESVETLRKWGKLWLAMRKDCGHPDTQLKTSEILASFVNDVDKHHVALDRS